MGQTFESFDSSRDTAIKPGLKFNVLLHTYLIIHKLW